MSTNRRRALETLGNERGNMAVSVVFVLFTTLFLGIIVTSLLSTMGAATTTRNSVAASQAVSAVADAYLDRAGQGAAPADGELCVGDICAAVTAAADEDGVRTVTVTATEGEATYSRTIPVPGQAGTMITGYKDGNPVWGNPAKAPAAGTDDTAKEDKP